MWDNIKSAKLTQILTAAFLVLSVPVAVFAPYILNWYMSVTGKPDTLITPLLITVYSLYVPAVIALVCLFLLLTNICKGDIFIDRNTLFMRIISWCCGVAGVISLVSGFYYLPFVLIGVAALFMMLIVRVVKNTIAQAILIKSENDFTI
ncbi:MAG: DUF2975 domain-containing protein [Ruminococcaceae bacterium]|nr:DUF2975 domain-containing protein [Oscillospiraceae bacterium]